MLRRAWFYLSGYVIIRVKGNGSDRFLSELARKGIPVWEAVRLSPEMLVARLRAGDFPAIRKLVRFYQVDVEIVHKRGLPFFWQRLASRKFLIGGAILCLAIVYFLSTFVWFVRVDGANQVSESEILAAAREAGLTPGVPRAQVDPEDVEHHLLTEIETLAWTGVEIRGTLAVIRIEEKILPQEEETRPGDIIARKDGIISQIIPFVGEVMVEEGQTVAAGEMLISGQITPGTPGPDGEEMGSLLVRAAGQVKARVWYEGVGEAALVVEEKKQTGRRKSRLEVRIGSLHLGIGPTRSPFPDSVVEKQASSLYWRQTELPVQVIRKDYLEVQSRQVVLDQEEARRLAVDQALEAAGKMLPPEARVLNREVSVQYLPDAKLMQARVLIEVLEDIAEFRPFESASQEAGIE